MRRPKQLCCIDLRKHLCWEAQKCTSLCRDCKHPCEAGIEYRERFLSVTMPTIASRNAAKLKALVDAYVKRKQEKLRISEVLNMVAPYGIRTTSGLSDAWKRERKAMMEYAEEYCLDQYFTPRGRLTDEERSFYYEKRLKEYDAWRNEGLSWLDIGEKQGIGAKAAKKRYQVAKEFFASESC